MKTALRQAAVAWMAALSVVPASAFAENDSVSDAPKEISLDIDNDGRMDRAILIKQPRSGSADLHIYLAAGDDTLDPSRPPDFLKPGLAHGTVVYLDREVNGSLMVKYGCGGCSNDYITTLMIVRRGGEFLVAGFTYDWDTRNEGIGGCDINFLTGKGVTSRGLEGKSKPIKAKFTPVKVADWSDDKRPKACDF